MVLVREPKWQAKRWYLHSQCNISLTNDLNLRTHRRMPVGGFLEVISSVLGRIMVKTITDFTSIVQFRHPYDLGGVQWILALLLTLAGLPFAVWVYRSKIGEDAIYGGARTAAFSLLPFVATLLAIFFMTIESKYIRTFVTFRRARDLTIKTFRERDDATKAAYTVQVSRHLWQSIDEEVRGWLDEAMRSRIPLDLIPSAAERVKESKRGISISGEGGFHGNQVSPEEGLVPSRNWQQRSFLERRGSNKHQPRLSKREMQRLSEITI